MATLERRLRAAIRRRLSPWRQRRAIKLVRRLGDRVSFDEWQRAGWHLLPVHYYSPVPDTRALSPSLWQPARELLGLDFRAESQIALARSLKEEVGAEYDALPRELTTTGFYLWNSFFESVDAEVAYAMLRRHRPDRVVEVGSGWSTLLALRALDANGHGVVEAYEPFPPEFLKASTHPRLKLSKTGIQAVPLDVFTSLGDRDVLFIDSTHVARIGSDVLYEILDVLPRLAPGVLVHVHDVFLPAEYPRDWVMDLKRFWNEQYLLRAFLTFNDAFEVVWGSHYMHLNHPGVLAETFASYDPARVRPASFWMKRR